MASGDKKFKERTISDRDQAADEIAAFLQGNVGGTIIIGIGILLVIFLVLSFFGL
jgi:hypothetical protein